MKFQALESRMRDLEYFHSLRLLPETWVIIRVDSRGFSKLTQSRFKKPFDQAVYLLMVQTAKQLLTELQGLYAYTESDEISVLCPMDWNFCKRSLEKTVSLSAAIASASFTQAAGFVGCFDSRVWLGANSTRVIDYFSWRQADARRCALNNWCYWLLRQAGKSADEATKALSRQSVAAKQQLLLEYDVDFNTLPAWPYRGAGLYWEHYTKVGYDPVKKQPVMTGRRRVNVNEVLPMKNEYRQLIQTLLEPGAP